MVKRAVCVAFVLAICSVLLVGCGQTQDKTPEIYENQELGFRIELPNTWEGRYTVAANPQSQSGVVIETEWGGVLCYIFKQTAQDWSDSGKGSAIPVEHLVLGENDESVYLLYFATDVNYDPENEEQVNTYAEMREDLYSITFEILT